MAQQDQTAQDEQPAMPGIATRFQPGQSGNPSGRAKDGSSWRDVPEVLRIMRKVWGQDEEKDKGPKEAVYRKLLNDDIKAFTSQLNALERQYLATRGKAGDAEANDQDGKTEAALPADEGTEVCMDLLDQLLEQHKGA